MVRTKKKDVSEENHPCPCHGENLEKLFQPSILTILAEGRTHGYEVVKRLAEMPLQRGACPDLPGVYRLLRGMEKRGLVISSWDRRTKGPAKRYYTLSSEGVTCLRTWENSLKEYRQGLNFLLRCIRRGLETTGR